LFNHKRFNAGGSGLRLGYSEAIAYQSTVLDFLNANFAAKHRFIDTALVFPKVNHIALGIIAKIIALLFQRQFPGIADMKQNRAERDFKVLPPIYRASESFTCLASIRGGTAI